MLINRLKPFTPLVDMVLDELPESVWESKTSTFLDPSMGGGQFIRCIIERLRKAGHSDKNISQRVRGYEESRFMVDTACNMHQLIGKFHVIKYDDFYTNCHDRVSVVVTNPLYVREKLTRTPIWHKIIDKCLDIADYVGAIVPRSIMTGAQYQPVRSKANSSGLQTFREVEHHFFDSSDKRIERVFFMTSPTADKFTGAWLSDRARSVVQKIEAVYGNEYYHNPSLNSRFAFTKSIPIDQQGDVIDKISLNGYNVVTGQLDTHYNTPRLVTSYYSNAPTLNQHLQVMHYSDSLGVPSKYRYLAVENETQAKYIRSYLQSDFVTKLFGVTRTSRTLDKTQMRFIPPLPMDKYWTTDEIIEVFELDNDDIFFITGD